MLEDQGVTLRYLFANNKKKYVVTERKGTVVTAKCNEKEITRISSHFKHIDDSHMTGVELDNESDEAAVNTSIMPSDHPPNITEPTPTTTAVEN